MGDGLDVMDKDTPINVIIVFSLEFLFAFRVFRWFCRRDGYIAEYRRRNVHIIEVRVVLSFQFI